MAVTICPLTLRLTKRNVFLRVYVHCPRGRQKHGEEVEKKKRSLNRSKEPRNVWRDIFLLSTRYKSTEKVFFDFECAGSLVDPWDQASVPSFSSIVFIFTGWSVEKKTHTHTYCWWSLKYERRGGKLGDFYGRLKGWVVCIIAWSCGRVRKYFQRICLIAPDLVFSSYQPGALTR